MSGSKPYFHNLSLVATVVSRIKNHFIINRDTQFLKHNGLNNSLRLNPENRSVICETIVATFFTCGIHKEAKLIQWDEKIPLAMFAFEIQTFQLLKNFVAVKPIGLLSQITWIFHSYQIFYKMSIPKLDQAQEKTDIGIIIKIRVTGFR